MTDATPIYLSIDEWVYLAAEILEIDPATIGRVANLTLADWALHAPAAGFAGDDAVATMIAVADKTLDVAGLADWLRAHTT